MKSYEEIIDSNVNLSNQKLNEGEKKILIIDDDQDVLDWFKSIKEPGSHYSFHFLDNELKILEVLRETDPDMVFLDICLNSISGRKIGEIIQATSYFQIPIVYMSSRRNWTIGLPIADQFFLPKPLDKKTVIGKIQKILKVK